MNVKRAKEQINHSVMAGHIKPQVGSSFIKALEALAEEDEPAHYSDCAVHNEPAYPNGPCDCRKTSPQEEKEALHGGHVEDTGRKMAWVDIGEIERVHDKWRTRTINDEGDALDLACDLFDAISVILGKR